MIQRDIHPYGTLIRTLKTLQIGVDIDDVVTGWYKASHEECVAAGITNGVTPTTWKPYEEYGCEDQVWYDVLDAALKRGYMLDLEPLPGAREALDSLWWAGHSVHLITARGFFQNGDLIREHTRQWVSDLQLRHESLDFRKDKGRAAVELGLDYFIDDNVRNVQSVAAESSAVVYLLNQPWNADGDWPAERRVDSLEQFAEIILEAS